MELLKLGFWLKLSFMMMTTFFMTSYILEPSQNQCQMTFMMEPPRFIPIALDPDYMPIKISDDYKLYMYSEFGFPLEMDLGRDLNDSMPILFVPGNAGSYQQVRSLASTCIKHQLQSLDAHKFIFYTIDFQAQLSGISGDLIEKQIDYVHASLNQISQLHPADTNGVIVVGHSVGGFLSKAVFTRPNFRKDLVPLLINLASPLTQPYLNFDAKMRSIYEKTNSYWSRSGNRLKTVSVSISGGQSDKLVPVHQSMDPNYDISMTTSSIQDVWLTMDHVCITWCRELMHKLASLLSRVMDKRSTSLISDRRLLVSKISEHLTTITDKERVSKSNTNQKIIKPHNFIDFHNSHSFTRSDLLEDSMVLNITERDAGDLFIWLEYINKMRDTGLYGCSNLEFDANSSHALCVGKVNLLDHALHIPSRRYEPKRKIITLQDEDNLRINYLLIDFSVARVDEYNQNKVPESIHIQVLDYTSAYDLNIPTMFQYYSSKIFGQKPIPHLGKLDNKPVAIISYKLNNLIHESQHYTFKSEFRDCSGRIDTLALLSRDKILRESFHPEKGKSSVIIKLNSQESIRMRSSRVHRLSDLKIYFDGTCKVTATLEFDWYSLVELFIQKYLSVILSVSCYFLYSSIIRNFEKLENRPISSRLSKSWYLRFIALGGLYIILNSKLLVINSIRVDSESLTRFIMICAISFGITSTFEYFINRTVDLFTILSNVQSTIKEEFKLQNELNSKSNANGFTRQSSATNANRILHYFNERSLLGMLIIPSLLLSESMLSTYMLLILIRLEFKLVCMSTKAVKQFNCLQETTREKYTRINQVELHKLEVLQQITVNAASLCAIGLLANIPNSLLVFNKISEPSSFNISAHTNPFYFTVTLVLNSVVILYNDATVAYVSETRKAPDNQAMFAGWLKRVPFAHAHFFALIPLTLIGHDIRNIANVQLVTFTWLASKLLITAKVSKFKSE